MPAPRHSVPLSTCRPHQSPPPPFLLREWRRRRDAFLLCRRRFYENKKRLESSSCWAFWPRLFERFDVIRAVAGPGAEDVCGHMVKYL